MDNKSIDNRLSNFKPGKKLKTFCFDKIIEKTPCAESAGC